MAAQGGSPDGAPRSTPRGGSRRGPKPKRSFRPELLGLGAGALLALAAWALLVWLAIDAGRRARGGESGDWLWLALASVGAVACLFACLWLVTALLRRVGILEPSRRAPSGPARH